MNRLHAIVTDIQGIDNLSLVKFQVQEEILSMMSLGLHNSIQINTQVVLGIKATNITLAKKKEEMHSIPNQLPCIIESISKGSLLCSVKLNFKGEVLETIITLESAIRMDLQQGDAIIALINESELSILEVQGIL